MNFTEAVNQVLAIVNRPDKINAARREVNAAITFYSLDFDYSFDFEEQQVSIESNEYTQAFSLSSLTRFRKFRYIKRGGTVRYLTPIADPEMVAACPSRDKYYQVGTNINISLAATASYLDVGYWKYPPLLTDDVANRTFWMLDMQPYMVIDKAASALFIKDLGDAQNGQLHAGYAREANMAFRLAVANA